MMEFLNNNAGAIQTILVFLLVVITAFYAYITKRILESQEKTVMEIERQGEMSNRAFMVVRVALRYQLFFELRISNEGRSAATDVAVSIDKALYQYGEEKYCLNDLPFFSTPTRLIPPGTQYLFELWSSHQCIGPEKHPNCPTEFTVKLSYQSLGKRYVEEWPISLDLYFMQARPASTVEESVQKASQELAKELSEIRRGLEKLDRRVDQIASGLHLLSGEHPKA